MKNLSAFSPTERVDVTCPEDIKSDFLRGLYEYWRKKAGQRCCPSRQDLTPEELFPWLGSVSLLDVVDDGADMIYRLAGVDVVAACGMEYTDRRLSEVDWGARRERIIDEYQHVARTGLPLLVRSPLVSQDSLYETRMVPKLMLPLSGDGTACDKLLTCFDLNPDA